MRAELANLRSAYRWSVERDHVALATDIAAHAALMGFSVELFETDRLGGERCSTRRRGPTYDGSRGCTPPPATPASSGVRPRPPSTPTGPPSSRSTPATSPASPGTRRSSRPSGQVYCGDLDRYVELTGEVAALPGPSRAFGVAAYVDGLQSAGRVEEALALTDSALTAARELGNPYWIAYTLWIVGLALSKVDPQRALETWDEGVAHLAEHDVRFFEGFLARDAALLHTSDGQLETALTLFGTAIEAFLRSGAEAQLIITLASLPALFERLGRPAAACTLLGAMAREPASFHHVPTLAALAERLRESLGEERAGRCAASGAAFDLPEAAAYALHQIDEAAQALAAVGRRNGPAGLTARETQVLGLIADGATTRDISERLFISAKTADNHIQHIYIKLGVTNRAAATRWALDHGLVEPTVG